MSYILDALRRAEVERARERGKVPGLHDPAPAAASAPAARSDDRDRRVRIGGGVVAVLVAAGLAWAWRERGEPAPVIASVTSPVATPAPLPSPAPAPVPAPVPVPVPIVPPTRAEPASPVLVPRSEAPRELAPVPALPRAIVSAPAVAPTASTASRIVDASELPEDVRRALPPLSFGGAMDSDTPSARLLIVNGQVLHEGDPVARGLVLEQIRLKSAVLAFRGYRYLVSY